jgi:hypothetical protein
VTKGDLDPDLVAELVRVLDAEVCNGGFNQYFFTAAGDRAGQTLEALSAIGALGSLAIMASVCATFPGGFPPADQVERRKLLETVDPESERFAAEDALFQESGEDLAALAKDYRRR